MKNSVQWFEIPTKDLERAREFYLNVFNLDFDYTEMPDSKMYMFGNPENIGACGALILSKENTPSANGATIYFSCKDIDEKLDLVRQNRGEVIIPKSNIGEFGSYAHFLDSEGNKLGLYSDN